LASGLAVTVPTTVVDTTTTIPPPPPSFAYLFHSDWSTATGTFTSALLDVSQDQPWDVLRGNGDGGAAVTDSVPWPNGIANALSIAHIGVNDNPGVRLAGSLPTFTNGSRAYRFYLKNIIPDDHRMGDDLVHPFQDGPGGGSNTNFQFELYDNGNGTYCPRVLFSGAPAGGGGAHIQRYTIGGAITGSTCALPKGTAYRFELKFTYNASADGIDGEFRVYNPDGSLRAGTNQWLRVSDREPSSSTRYFAVVDRTYFTSLQIGTNGWGGGTTSAPYVTWHWGAVAICTDWCGPYADGR
jgi:hypothetical protein